MNLERRIQTQLIIARILIREKQKNSILSNISIRDISDWTEFSEEEIREELELCEKLNAPELSRKIAAGYASRYQAGGLDNSDVFAYFYCIYLHCGFDFTVSGKRNDLDSWLEETIQWMRYYMQIDFGKIPEGTVTTTIFRKSLEYYRASFWDLIRQYVTQGYDPEVLALILNVPYDKFLREYTENSGVLSKSTP